MVSYFFALRFFAVLRRAVDFFFAAGFFAAFFFAGFFFAAAMIIPPLGLADDSNHSSYIRSSNRTYRI